MNHSSASLQDKPLFYMTAILYWVAESLSGFEEGVGNEDMGDKEEKSPLSSLF
jgi:hypothetical protein